MYCSWVFLYDLASLRYLSPHLSHTCSHTSPQACLSQLQSGDKLVLAMDVTDPHGQEVQLKIFAHDLAAPDAVVEKFCDYHGFQPPEACRADIMRAFTPDLGRLRALFATGSKSPVPVEGATQQPQALLQQQALLPTHTDDPSPRQSDHSNILGDGVEGALFALIWPCSVIAPGGLRTSIHLSAHTCLNMSILMSMCA